MIATEKFASALNHDLNKWIDELRLEQNSLEVVKERERAAPRTSGETEIISFEEYKCANTIKVYQVPQSPQRIYHLCLQHLQHLIGTGSRDLDTCKGDVVTLRDDLQSSRRKLFLGIIGKLCYMLFNRTYEYLQRK